MYNPFYLCCSLRRSKCEKQVGEESPHGASLADECRLTEVILFEREPMSRHVPFGRANTGQCNESIRKVWLRVCATWLRYSF